MTIDETTTSSQTATRARATIKPEWLQVCEEIARRHGLTFEALKQKSRRHKLVAARRECYSFLHHMRGWSHARIGTLFGRDHSTIVVALASEERRAAKLKYSLDRYWARRAVRA